MRKNTRTNTRDKDVVLDPQARRDKVEAIPQPYRAVPLDPDPSEAEDPSPAYDDRLTQRTNQAKYDAHEEERVAREMEELEAAKSAGEAINAPDVAAREAIQAKRQQGQNNEQ